MHDFLHHGLDKLMVCFYPLVFALLFVFLDVHEKPENPLNRVLILGKCICYKLLENYLGLQRLRTVDLLLLF